MTAVEAVKKVKLSEQLALMGQQKGHDQTTGCLASTVPMVSPGASPLATTPSGCSDVAVS